MLKIKHFLQFSKLNFFFLSEWMLFGLKLVLKNKAAVNHGHLAFNGVLQPSDPPVTHSDVFSYLIWMPKAAASLVDSGRRLLLHVITSFYLSTFPVCKYLVRAEMPQKHITHVLLLEPTMLDVLSEGWRPTISYLDSWVQFSLQAVILKPRPGFTLTSSSS